MLDDYFVAFSRFLTTGKENEDLEHALPPNTNRQVARIYRNGFLKTCVDTLAANYPSVVSVVGDDYFRHQALAFVHHYPPTSPGLTGYGQQFAPYLQQTLADHKLPYLADIARLDAAWTRSYFATDHTTLSGEDINALAIEMDITTLHLSLTPHALVQPLDYAVTGTWIEIRDGRPLGEHLVVQPDKETTLLWRKAGAINARPLSPAEHDFLARIDTGQTLGEAAEAASTHSQDFDISTYFSALLEHGILQRIDQP